MTSDDEQMTENGEKLKTHVQDVRSVQGVQTWVFFLIKYSNLRLFCHYCRHYFSSHRGGKNWKRSDTNLLTEG